MDFNYNFSDALLEDYIIEGWARDEKNPGKKFYITTSAVEFKNLITTLAATITGGGRIIVANSGIGNEILYVYGSAFDYIHDNLLDLLTDYYGYVHLKNIESATVGFPTADAENDVDLEGSVIADYVDDWDWFVDIYLSEWFPKDNKGNPDYAATESKVLMKDFAPGQSKEVIKKKYKALPAIDGAENYVYRRALGKNFELDCYSFSTEADFKVSKLYNALKSEIIEVHF